MLFNKDRSNSIWIYVQTELSGSPLFADQTVEIDQLINLYRVVKKIFANDIVKNSNKNAVSKTSLSHVNLYTAKNYRIHLQPGQTFLH